MESSKPAKISQILLEQLEKHKKITQSLETNKSNPEKEKLSVIIEEVLRNKA